MESFYEQLRVGCNCV